MRHPWKQDAAAGARPGLALALILGVGFALRVAHLGSGIPFAVGVDEPAIMTTVVRILKSGDFNPRFFEYPTGYIYVQTGVAIVNFLVGAMRHSWKAVEQVAPADFYHWGRAVTAILGTATIALLYRAGVRWGTRPALIAAALLAVMPMHVRESHFVLTDVPMTFAAALAFLLSLRAAERPAPAAFALAGAAAGLAAGIKYNGLMAVVMPLAAVAAAGPSWGRRAAALAAASAACVAAFFVTTPYALLDLPAFLNGFGIQADAFSGRALSGEPSWLLYAKHLRLAFGWPAAMLAVAGLVLACVRAAAGPDRLRWIHLVVFPAAYFWLITGWGLLYARYALPLVPFLALMAGIAAAALLERLDRLPVRPAIRVAAALALLLAAIAPGSLRSADWVRQHGVETTQALAWKWVSRHVWPGSMIVSEARGFEVPQPPYRAESVPSLAGCDPAELAAAGVEWLVLSSDAWGASRSRGRTPPGSPPAEYAAILSQASDVRVFAPTPQHPGPHLRLVRIARR